MLKYDKYEIRRNGGTEGLHDICCMCNIKLCKIIILTICNTFTIKQFTGQLIMQNSYGNR